MQSKATTVEKYLAELPAERRTAISAVRKVILANLGAGFEEGMQYGMIGYYVPHRLYPAGYHCDPKQPLCFAGLAWQKQYMSLYLMCIYGSPDHRQWFEQAWAKAGKKLNMGKSCLRFRMLTTWPWMSSRSPSGACRQRSTSNTMSRRSRRSASKRQRRRTKLATRRKPASQRNRRSSRASGREPPASG